MNSLGRQVKRAGCILLNVSWLLRLLSDRAVGFVVFESCQDPFFPAVMPDYVLGPHVSVQVAGLVDAT